MTDFNRSTLCKLSKTWHFIVCKPIDVVLNPGQILVLLKIFIHHLSLNTFDLLLNNNKNICDHLDPIITRLGSVKCGPGILCKENNGRFVCPIGI